MNRLLKNRKVHGWYMLIGDGKDWHASIYPTNQADLPGKSRENPIAVTNEMSFEEIHITDPDGKHYFFTDAGVPKQWGEYRTPSAGFDAPGWVTANQWADWVLGLLAGTAAYHHKAAIDERERLRAELQEEQRQWDAGKLLRIQQEQQAFGNQPAPQQGGPQQPVTVSFKLSKPLEKPKAGAFVFK